MTNDFKQITGEVYVAQRPIVRVGLSEMAEIKALAVANPRQRARICAHKDGQDRLHEMLIALTCKVYIRPHKHINKTESFHVLEGAAKVVFFDENGGVEEVVDIGDYGSGKTFYFRNDDSRYHTQIITSDALVFHEVTNGPFNREDTVFAPWAPEESDVPAVGAYLATLKSHVLP